MKYILYILLFVVSPISAGLNAVFVGNLTKVLFDVEISDIITILILFLITLIVYVVFIYCVIHISKYELVSYYTVYSINGLISLPQISILLVPLYIFVEEYSVPNWLLEITPFLFIILIIGGILISYKLIPFFRNKFHKKITFSALDFYSDSTFKEKIEAFENRHELTPSEKLVEKEKLKQIKNMDKNKNYEVRYKRTRVLLYPLWTFVVNVILIGTIYITYIYDEKFYFWLLMLSFSMFILFLTKIFLKSLYWIIKSDNLLFSYDKDFIYLNSDNTKIPLNEIKEVKYNAKIPFGFCFVFKEKFQKKDLEIATFHSEDDSEIDHLLALQELIKKQKK